MKKNRDLLDRIDQAEELERQPEALTKLLAELRERYEAKPPGPCRVCGAPLQVGAVDGFAREWYCSSPAASVSGKPGGIWGSEAGTASRHWWASQVKQRHGDDRVARLSDFVEQLAARHPESAAALIALLIEPEEEATADG